MNTRMLRIWAVASLLLSTSVFAQEHWVATWAASPIATNIPAAPAKPVAAGAPAAAPAKPGPAPLRSFNNQTIRMVVDTSIGGRSVRVELANTFGAERLKIGSAHIALRDHGSAIIPASDRKLTFSGLASATIPPGASMISDPVDLSVPAVGDLVVSVYLPGDSGPPTQHATGLHTTYISSEGDFTAVPDFTAARTSNSWYFLSGVQVLAPADTGVIVAFGDSITDGATSTNDANASWPSVLASRLHDAGATNLAVINEGISGNRVLGDGAGVSVLARFERDVLAQPGIKYLVFMEAINDIGGASRAGATPVTTEEIIAIYKQMIARAHMRGIKVIGATLTPYEGAAYYSEPGEGIRTAVNQWIRTTGMLDGVVDFDLVTRDPEHPGKFRPGFNIRDNLHPNDAGYRAMAESIDLSLFGVKR
ncbi:MAG TPA: SGNH/GDSL hydrolase family protein [Bryobacteraceae bacterium]|nr:SGNH/GDSL hydrolase family protein [Bryobacteraceae bacterium]